MSEEPILRINEIFHSVQGESTWSGLPCVFVRLTGCPLRCSYCDTEYAFREGTRRTLSELLQEILDIDCDLVELTGGEPLAQKQVFPFMKALCDAGRTVLVETSNGVDIQECDPRVIRILDLKTPGSGQVHRNRMSNLEDLRPQDEVKFVLCDRADYEWARAQIIEHDLIKRCHSVLLSPTFQQQPGLEIAGCPSLEPRRVVEWMLEDGLRARLQLQMHKFIWDPSTRGV